MKYCSDCKDWGTINCPSSRLCYAINSKPYFKLKRINKFKEFINRILNKNN